MDTDEVPTEGGGTLSVDLIPFCRKDALGMRWGGSRAARRAIYRPGAWALAALVLQGLNCGQAFQAGVGVGLAPHAGQAGPAPRNGPWRSGRSLGGPGAARMQLDPVVANLVVGAVSGTVSNMAVFPFELAKTKMQLARGAEEKAKYSSLAVSLATITAEDGVGALWSGSLPVLLGGAPESALQLAAHSWMIAAMVAIVAAPGTAEGDLPLTCQLLAGVVAGVATLLATQPMEVLRLRAAAGDKRGMVAQVREMGIAGIFGNAEATLLRDIPFSALYFPLYCKCKAVAGELLEHMDVPNAATVSLLAAGFVSGAVASYLTTPADTIKTRIQSELPAAEAENLAPRLVMAFATKDNSETAEASGVARIKAVARQTVSAEGWPGLMTGAKVRVMKLAPNMALTLVMYETMQAALQPFLAAP